MSGASLIAAGLLPKIKFSNSLGFFSYFVGDPEELNEKIKREKEIYENYDETERANYKNEQEEKITKLKNTKGTIIKIGCMVLLVLFIFLIVFAASDSSVKSAFKWLSVASAIILGFLILVFARNNRNVIDKSEILSGVLGY
jgi:predicted RND superfamily exporter protein